MAERGRDFARAVAGDLEGLHAMISGGGIAFAEEGGWSMPNR